METRVVVLAALALLLVPAFGPANPVLIPSGQVVWTFDPATLELSGQLGNEEPLLFSAGAPATKALLGDSADGTAIWNQPESGLTIRATGLGDGGLEVNLVADKPHVLRWPIFPLQSERDSLIWPLGQGVIFPASDSFWQREIFAQEWNAAESLSLPLWAVSRESLLASWMTSSPFRNSILFEHSGDDRQMVVIQEFTSRSPSMEVTYRFHLDQNATPIEPALHFRSMMEESDGIVTLSEKAAMTPGVDRLRGAPHVYLWGDDAITSYDILPNAWIGFCHRLVEESETQPNSLAAHLRTTFTEEQWASVIECSTAEWPYEYLKDQIAMGLSAAIESDQFRAPDAMNARVQENRGLTRSESLLLNGTLLSETFPGVFVQPRTWGNGVSMKMLDALSDMELPFLKLCTDGIGGIDKRPWVAMSAAERGWLFGIYDSYHSIHDPSTAGSETTWDTAQMTEELFTGGAIMRADGQFRTGFQGVGRKLNPMVARPYVEQRVRQNFDNLPFTYYFMDCDATGELHDDFHPDHPMSIEEDAAARIERLKWIADEFNVVVGSEGGNAFAADALHTAEGVLGPYFGWDEPAMNDRESPYYRGRYYPPDAPEINFKPIPLTERFLKRNYTAASRIPLHAAAFHDAIVTTHHWNNGHFKYPELRAMVALTEILYLSPPLYHFNLEELKKRSSLVKEHTAVWSPLHREFGFAPMEHFVWLTADRTVQEARYAGGCRIVVNFGDSLFEGDNFSIPAMTALIDAPNVWDDIRFYTPTP